MNRDHSPAEGEPAPKQPEGDASFALCLCLGVALGTIWDNLALGLCLGLAAGLLWPRLKK